MTTDHYDYDVLIVGGGMVGSTLACALGDTPFKVGLLEAALPAPVGVDDPFDLRTSALSLASTRILENIGAWQTLVASQRLCPYRRIRVWEDGGAETNFAADAVGEEVLGYFLENRLLQHALLERVRALDNVDLLAPATPVAIRFAETAATVETGDRTLKARLLVGADGQRSKVRQASGIGVFAWDYEQGVVVASVKTALPQQDLTWQRFTPAGPQAFLPLAGPHATLVWYHRPREVQRLLALAEADFIRELEGAFPIELGGVEAVVERGSFPLQRQHANRYVDHRVALIGDAAHAIHPLAGQGVNLGLLDAAALRDVLLSAVARGRDIGDGELLGDYQRWRRRENLAMMTVVDVFYRLFGNDNTALRQLRNTGLWFAERLSPAKHQVMRYALGLVGRQPSLVKAPADFVAATTPQASAPGVGSPGVEVDTGAPPVGDGATP
ncbi:MAG: UbiH/UbiF/VisC/COQ6 family ubiquinone biosynthesis hydroxylase [Candidatus Competibacterales bacterium]